MLHIAGIPATGKSTFGRWLQKERGFLHVDVEAPGVLYRLQLESPWLKLFQENSASAFISQLRQLATDVVLDWGFPPTYLPQVTLLQKEGVEAWWFTAQTDIARARFVERGTVPLRAFEVQMSAIQERWHEIKAAFSPRIMETLHKGRGHLSPDQIWSEMERIRTQPNQSI